MLENNKSTIKTPKYFYNHKRAV